MVFDIRSDCPRLVSAAYIEMDYCSDYLCDSESPLAICTTARLLLGLSKVLKQQSTFIYGENLNQSTVDFRTHSHDTADALQLWSRLRRDMYLLTSEAIDMTDPKAR